MFKGLPLLQSLSVCANRLAGLPESIGALTAMQALRLDGNRLAGEGSVDRRGAGTAASRGSPGGSPGGCTRSLGPQGSNSGGGCGVWGVLWPGVSAEQVQALQ